MLLQLSNAGEGEGAHSVDCQLLSIAVDLYMSCISLEYGHVAISTPPEYLIVK